MNTNLNRRYRGYTLIELLVVLALIVVLVAMVGPLLELISDFFKK